MATSVIPSAAKLEITAGWAAESTAGHLRAALFLATSNCETQSLYSGCSDECAGTGYTAGGNLITVTSVVDGIDAKLAGTTSVWTTLTLASGAARYAVVYETVNSRIRGVFYLGGDYPCTAGTLTITWNPAGLIKVSSV
jgi:hypothetical protein